MHMICHNKFVCSLCNAVRCSLCLLRNKFSLSLCLSGEWIHQKIWKKNKQRNAVSWLLTPFLDCTYEERPYRSVDSHEQKWFVFLFFHSISTPKFTSSTRWKKNPSETKITTLRHKRHEPNLRVFFCISIDLMCICSAATSFLFTILKSFSSLLIILCDSFNS